jgi:hypothetical protein
MGAIGAIPGKPSTVGQDWRPVVPAQQVDPSSDGRVVGSMSPVPRGEKHVGLPFLQMLQLCGHRLLSVSKVIAARFRHRRLLWRFGMLFLAGHLGCHLAPLLFLELVNVFLS